jgi:glycosyltransferase involved in cell wall biosynthesis
MDTPRPLISVLVPVYNVERFVAESLESIARQTWPEIEVIVVDDASSDGTWEIVRAFAARDPRFVALRNERNLRIAGTLNRALSVAHGAFIARCDGDDVMMPDRLERQHAFLAAHPEVALVGCSFVTIDEAGRELRVHGYPSGAGLLKRLLPFTSPVSHIWLARRSLYDEVGGYRLASVEDYDFLLRADLAGHGIDNVPGYAGMKVRMRADNTVSRYGLTQRVLFNYARRLHRRAGDLAYSEADERSLVEGSRRGLMSRLHYLSDRLTQRGARSSCRPCALALYVLAAAVSPYKAQYFYLQVRVTVIKRQRGHGRLPVTVRAH